MGGAWTILGGIETVHDQLLQASARYVAETLALDDGQITLDLPPAVLGMLENASRDNVYYSIRHGDQLVTGYADLPEIVPRGEFRDDTSFSYRRYRDHTIRIAAETRRVPLLAGPVLVEVGETIGARQDAAGRMLAILAAIELALIGLLILMIPRAIRSGLSPLATLERSMEARSVTDQAPLPMERVPNELRQLVGAFNALLRRVDDAFQAMSRFSADASHQLRTPLSVLRTHIAVLEGQIPKDSEAASSLRDIKDASTRLQGLVIQLLNLARAESGLPRERSSEPIDIREIMRSVATKFAPHAFAAKMELHFEAEERPYPTRFDPVVLGEIAGNLLDNATRYGKPGGVIVIRILAEEECDVVEIEDDGPGIPEGEREKVFTRFYRLGRDQNRAGSGLGLAIVQTLATAIGAVIELEESGQGSGLRVRLSL